MRFFSYYLPLAPLRLVYMLQQVEYDSFKFADWADNMPNLLQVQTRQKLDLTARARITVFVAYAAWLIPLLAGIIMFALSKHALWLIVTAFSPLFCAVGLFLFNGLFGKVVVEPSQKREIAAAKAKLKKIAGIRVAVIGSYGKTTMKDILFTVLGEAKKVTVTPGNKNVLISHARWITKDVIGDEEVLIFEYGEAEPGDIAELASFSRPDIALITGLAPAHMDGYGSLDAIASDFNDINKFVSDQSLFINGESPELATRIKNGISYSQKEVDGWRVSDVKTTLDGTGFTMKKLKQTLKLHSDLLGAHNVGPLAIAAAIAARLGLTNEQIISGVAKTKPFEHRMQPYTLAGAHIIDDSYNGNLEGMKAGLALLKALPAKRKIYVTPGLVEQGNLTESVHKQLGKYIAGSNPDKVVLMQNSVTQYIQSGLKEAKYKGSLVIEKAPLDFYKNMEHFVAGGDLLMMQNDWTDNYS
jgi:UDP-N-acetylmuramoyl-tripeptide--D-alanyl-D-alanine ligase